MGDISDQVGLHLFVLHAGAYRLADTFADVIYRIRHLPVVSVKSLCIQLIIHLAVTDPAYSLHNIDLFRFLFKSQYPHDTVQYNGSQCRKQP